MPNTEEGESSRAMSSSTSTYPLFTRHESQQSASTGHVSPVTASQESSAQKAPEHVFIANAPETIKSIDKKRTFWIVNKDKPEHVHLCRSVINVQSSEGHATVG
jgi:hypothetical protein